MSFGEDFDKALATAHNLEQMLGSPFDSTKDFSFQKIVANDEASNFPTDQLKILDAEKLFEEFIPSALGGRFSNLQMLPLVMRPIARRDLSPLLVKAQLFLGSLPIWIAGTQKQQERLAQIIRQDRVVALGLTEKESGSDLLSIKSTAVKNDSSWSLNAEKWMINNGTYGAGMTLLVKTHPKGGPLGLSLFFFDKDQQDPSVYRHLPKFKTHGVRGIDISGLAIQNAVLTEDNLIGREGHGFDLTLRTLLVSRALVSEATNGVIESLLRLTVEFTRNRRIYEKSVLDIPVVRSQMARANARLIMNECLIMMALKRAHDAPESLSLLSPLVKYFVPVQSEKIAQELAVTIGARHYLREEYCDGIVQKFLRDISLISLFDGSSQVNLSLIASLLKSVATKKTTRPLTTKDIISKCDFNNSAFDFSQLKIAMKDPEELTSSLRNISSWSTALDKTSALALQNSFQEFESKNLTDTFQPQSLDGFRRAEKLGWYAALAALSWMKEAHSGLISNENYQLAVIVAFEMLRIPTADISQQVNLENAILEDVESRLKENQSLGLWKTVLPTDWKVR